MGAAELHRGQIGCSWERQQPVPGRLAVALDRSERHLRVHVVVPRGRRPVSMKLLQPACQPAERPPLTWLVSSIGPARRLAGETALVGLASTKCSEIALVGIHVICDEAQARDPYLVQESSQKASIDTDITCTTTVAIGIIG
eukprot:2650018-Pyramimonas_sp.AAC.1